MSIQEITLNLLSLVSFFVVIAVLVYITDNKKE